MTQGEIASVVVPLLIAGGMYLYILNERRKLIAAREKRHRPAE
ncbi:MULTISPECIES: hypothetical protein [Sphingomonas]|jgi:hypothetical protein|nr:MULTISPECIES: hypothetical protein [Sphingomonas]